MSLTATCDRCQRQLWVDDVGEQWLTCPRCLHEVRNPWYGRDAAIVDQPREGVPENRGLQCDSCGETLKPNWRVCPNCDMPVHRPPRRSTGVSLECDVRRDRRGSIIGLSILGGLLLLGGIAFIATGGVQLVSASPEGPAVFGITLLVFAAIVIGVGCLMYFSRSNTAIAVGGTVGGVAAGVTLTLGFVLLIVFAICAGISNFFDTCSKEVAH